MKFVMDERIKHRMVGAVVILSIALVFLPAMLKQQGRNFEESVSVSLKLPEKPLPPKVEIPKQTAMLNSVKVAHVDVPKVTDAPGPSTIARAEPLSKQQNSVLVKVDLPLKSVVAAVTRPVKPVVKVASVPAQGKYSIQLASFTQQRNAEFLVARLRKQGYVAKYNKFIGKKGEFYQVVAGMVNKRNDAVNLQKKLAENMQLNGFIVKTGVS